MFMTKNYAHIDRYVDYSMKYGVGYALTNGSYGVMYNDLSRLVQEANKAYVLM